MEFIAVPFEAEELNFIREAWPGLSVVEAVRNTALASSANRIERIGAAHRRRRRNTGMMLPDPPNRASAMNLSAAERAMAG